MATYQDPSAIKMENGRTMADYVRGGPKGLRGVVIAASTAGGTPINYNPHDASQTRINVVDPEGRNLYGVTLDQITKDRVDAATAVAIEQFPGDDIESTRERAAMVFEELARMASSSVQKTPVKRKPTKAPPPPPQDDDEEESVKEALLEETQAEISAGLPIDKIDRSYSPLAAFGLKKQVARTAHGGTVSVAGQQRVSAPQKLVYFEKEGIGMVPAFFHDIIVSTVPSEDTDFEETGFMVLIYDLRFEQNAARWFPPSNDPYQRPWAVQINDDNRLYLVHTTGFQYIYDNREYCVLMIERAVLSAGG